MTVDGVDRKFYVVDSKFYSKAYRTVEFRHSRFHRHTSANR